MKVATLLGYKPPPSSLSDHLFLDDSLVGQILTGIINAYRSHCKKKHTAPAFMELVLALGDR